MATFTIYLLRDTVQTAEDAVVQGAFAHEIVDGLHRYGKLFVKQTRPRPPKWSDLFDGFIERRLLGYVQSSAAAFVVDVDDRLFALTFGQGRFLLHPDAYEERFGLVVTLNSIEQDALRSIDKRTFIDDQNSRIQTSQAAPALSFGVDIERDLIRGVVGRPKERELGRRLAGADALTVTTDVAIPGLRKLLRAYLRKFLSKDYQANFPWIDQVRQLHPKGTIAKQLDDHLVDAMRSAWANRGLVEGCWLAVPEIVDWEVVNGFKFTTSHKEGVSSDLHLPGLVAAFGNEDPTLEFLRKHYVMSVDEEEQIINRWPAYRCVHCEVDKDGKSYILSAGRWFEVDKDFVNAVEASFQSIPRYEQDLPLCNHEKEDDYNRFVAENSGGRWCLMDKKLLHVGGIYDKVEFCDLYGDQVLVHVKHYGSSSVLGHLFNQGLVSGELLRSHPDYVRLANAELPKAHHLADDPPNATITRGVADYTIVFAIISQSDKPDLHLPFFAKVILKSVYARLSELGYARVMLVKVSCDPDLRVRRRLKPAAKKK